MALTFGWTAWRCEGLKTCGAFAGQALLRRFAGWEQWRHSWHSEPLAINVHHQLLRDMAADQYPVPLLAHAQSLVQLLMLDVNYCPFADQY